MSSTQKERLQWAYDYGLEHGLGESMRAICWQESSAGLDLENEKDGSFGLFGGKALIVATRFYKTWPYRPRPELIRQSRYMLINNPRFAAAACVNELQYWQKQRGADRWTKVWASYNAGWDWWNGKSYAADIWAKIKFLRVETTNSKGL